MNRLTLFHASPVPSVSKETDVDAVQRISAATGAKTSVVRTFAKLSAPENSEMFTAKAAHKAFQHLKTKAKT
jgi:hypothetical protein